MGEGEGEVHWGRGRGGRVIMVLMGMYLHALISESRHTHTSSHLTRPMSDASPLENFRAVYASSRTKLHQQNGGGGGRADGRIGRRR